MVDKHVNRANRIIPANPVFQTFREQRALPSIRAFNEPLHRSYANSISFRGTTAHPSGTEWSVHGSIDPMTGSLGATVTWFNPKTNNLLIRMNYELICKPT